MHAYEYYDYMHTLICLHLSMHFSVQLQNKGTIRMDYNWQVVMDDFMHQSRSVTFAAETIAGSRAGSITPSVFGDMSVNMPFTVEPSCGSIAVGKKVDIKVNRCN